MNEWTDPVPYSSPRHVRRDRTVAVWVWSMAALTGGCLLMGAWALWFSRPAELVVALAGGLVAVALGLLGLHSLFSIHDEQERPMGFNLNESNAVNQLLDSIRDDGQPIPAELESSLVTLADAAYRRLVAGWTGDQVRAMIVERNHADRP